MLQTHLGSATQTGGGMEPSVSTLLGNWGKERKAVCSQWLWALRVQNLHPWKPSVLTHDLIFPWCTAWHIFSVTYSAHKNWPFIIFSCKSESDVKCLGWYSIKWLFHCSASCAIICPIHPNTCLTIIKWILLSVYVASAFTQNMLASVVC